MKFTHTQEMSINRNPAQMEEVRWMERFPDVFGPRSTREEVLAELKTDETLFTLFDKLSWELKEEFVSFCMGCLLYTSPSPRDTR